MKSYLRSMTYRGVPLGGPLLLLLALLAITLVGTLAIQASLRPAQAAGATWLRVEGHDLVDESGNRVVLRGANIVRFTWKWPSSSAMETDFKMARTFVTPVSKGGWGANSFTLWVDSNPVLNNDSQYMQWLDGMVAIAKEYNAYVILSWHADNPHDEHPEKISSRGFQAMAALARRYKNLPNVIYATQAEPGFYTTSASRWRELRDQQEQMIDKIRAENPKALVGVSGTNWSQTVHWMLTDPVRRDNIFVKPHLYATMPEVIKERQIDEIAKRWPVVIGEFGTGGRMDNDDSREMIRYADEHLDGWQAWNLSEVGPPVLLSSATSMTPTSYGQVVKTELQRQVNKVVATPTPTPTPKASTTTAIPLRVNVGGGQVTDSKGNVWLADQAYGPGKAYGYVDGNDRNGSASHNVNVAGTNDDAIFTTERWGLAAYRVDLPNGTYDVRLLFAETYEGITGKGQRVFDVAVEGKTVASKLDLYAEAGFAKAVVKEARNVKVSDGRLDVTFTHREDYAALKGIEVLAAGTLASPTPTPTPTPKSTSKATSIPAPVPSSSQALPGVSVPFRVNVGGGKLTTSDGKVWVADQSYSSSKDYGYVNGNDRYGSSQHVVDVIGTNDDALYTTERWGLAAYRVDLPNGTYDLRLYFAETYEGITGPGQRVFDVAVEGNMVAEGLDLYAEAGFARPYIKELRNVKVTDGRLDVTFTQRTPERTPIFKALEVLPAGTLPSPDPRVHVSAVEVWTVDGMSTGWEAFTRVSVRNGTLAPVSGAYVTMGWQVNGAAWTAACRTGFDGRCSSGSGTLPNEYTSAKVEVTDVSYGSVIFDAARGTRTASVDRP